MLTVELDPEPHAAFLSEVAASDRDAGGILRELVADYVERRRESRDYDEFLAAKIAAARRERSTGDTLDATEVEAEFATTRGER